MTNPNFINKFARDDRAQLGNITVNFNTVPTNVNHGSHNGNMSRVSIVMIYFEDNQQEYIYTRNEEYQRFKK